MNGFFKRKLEGGGRVIYDAKTVIRAKSAAMFRILPYIGPFPSITQKNVRHFAICYCNIIDIKLVFSSFKIGTLFSLKDPFPRGLCTGVVYKFLCAGCSACYVGETIQHFSTSVREQISVIGPRTFLKF